MRLFYYLFITFILISCSNNLELIFDEDNGGLFLPEGFQSLVVHEGIGQSRHLAVNENGDINFFVNAGREIVKLSDNLSPYDFLSKLSEKGLIEVLLRLIEFDGVNKEINENPKIKKVLVFRFHGF